MISLAIGVVVLAVFVTVAAVAGTMVTRQQAVMQNMSNPTTKQCVWGVVAPGEGEVVFGFVVSRRVVSEGV